LEFGDLSPHCTNGRLSPKKIAGVRITMNRKLAVALVFSLVIFFSPLTRAQDPNFAGAWAGVMNRPAGPAGLEIVLEHEGHDWKATVKMRVPNGELAPSVEALKINGSEMILKAVINGVAINYTGKFEGEQLKGTFESFRGDARVGAGTFALTRGGKMAAAQPAQSGQGVQGSQGSQSGGQMADPDFDARVSKPAYARNGPKVLFDEAHHNFHTASGRYKPFADLITNDGYQITPNQQKFSAERLKGYDILVISNALGAPRMNQPEASNPAFTDQECDAIRDWVKGGGSLLLIADHAPMGAANQYLGQRFGVDMSKMFTVDAQNYDKEANNPGFIIYTRESGRLADFAITRGRNDSERVNKIIAFTGQSLKGPAGSVAFMQLSDTAQDLMPGPGSQPVSAAGRAQGIAMSFGQGRIVVLGEAAMLSAQMTGPGGMKFGMNRPGLDNRQLALNIVHWLSGLLK
jgi:hypothetical protein